MHIQSQCTFVHSIYAQLLFKPKKKSNLVTYFRKNAILYKILAVLYV